MKNNQRFFNTRVVLLKFNAWFLLVVGGISTIQDLVGYRTGLGPLGKVLFNNWDAVAYTEAHGLAFIIGLILLVIATKEPRPFWHGIGAGVHILLGGSNLLFWGAFIEWGIVKPEIVVTSIHWLFVLAHLIALVLARKKTV